MDRKGVHNKVGASKKEVFQKSKNETSCRVEKRKVDFYLKFKT